MVLKKRGYDKKIGVWTMVKIKAVFFDIDDTLYDSTKLAHMARKNAIKAMIDAGLPEKDEKKVFKTLKKIIEKFGSNYPRHYDELIKEIGGHWNPKIIASGVVAYEHTKVGYLKPFPKIVPTILDLKNKYKLGIISNGLAIKQWEKLVGLGIHHLFDIVVTSEEEGSKKPDVKIFKHAMKQLDLNPEECIMIGDRIEIDITGAKAAGMHTVLISNRKIKSIRKDKSPEYSIKDISELLDILKDLG